MISNYLKKTMVLLKKKTLLQIKSSLKTIYRVGFSEENNKCSEEDVPVEPLHLKLSEEKMDLLKKKEVEPLLLKKN